MAIFWIFGLLMGASAFFFGSLIAHWNFSLTVGVALFTTIFWGIFLSGIVTWIRRWLVSTDRIEEYTEGIDRATEINRRIFWQRAVIIAICLPLLSVVAVILAVLGELKDALLVVLFAPLSLVAQFAIFFGPFVLFTRMGRQVLLPDDANYGVKVEDIRGQKAPVNEMRRILRLFEHGRSFTQAGGKRERGVLMVGPPGTGKTMLAKAIATAMRSPIIISSGAAYQGMFLGMDMLAVILAVRRAKKLAKRWGGCILFIDEFDALGQRRSGMGSSGGGMLGGMMGGGGQLGLNTLLVQMDGVDNPGTLRQVFRRFINVTLDGLSVPRRLGNTTLRLPQLKPKNYNILFLGATNRPQVLDEAVTRPGRFGRTITFRQPNWDDRRDIADLYFFQKAHDSELDRPERRAEFARVTDGYSPAMIEQALSLALMYAFEEGRDHFNWEDLRAAMGNIEAGLADPVEYNESEKLAIARHELGHALAAHFFLPDFGHVRLSIRKRSDTLGYHRNASNVQQFSFFRSHFAGRLRHSLGAIAAERVFYGENSAGVIADLQMATEQACHMIALTAMEPDDLDKKSSLLALSFGEQLISVAQITEGFHPESSIPGAALRHEGTRQRVATVLGAAYLDCWRLMFVNQAALDQAAQVLMEKGEMVGDEIKGLFDSLNLRLPEPSDPYPAPVGSIFAEASA